MMEVEKLSFDNTLDRIDGLLRYLEHRLTCRLPVPGEVYGLRTYTETPDPSS